MKKVELIARLIALEQGLHESRWKDFEAEALRSVRAIGLTKKELEEEYPWADSIIAKVKIMLKSIHGRCEIMARADRGRRSRMALN